MKKIIALILALVTTAFCFVSCGKKEGEVANDDLSYITKKGNLVIGITIYSPMNYYDENNELVGFDTELAKAVCEKLGVEAKFQVVEWSTKESELAAKSIDCIWNGLTYDEERAANMALSDKYMKNKQVVVAKADKVETFTSKEALSGATGSVEGGSAGEDIIATIDGVKSVNCDDQASAILEVKAGTSDFCIIDYVMAKSLIETEGSEYADLKVLDIDIADDEYFAIAFRRGCNTVDRVNEILRDLYKDGTVAKLAEKYGLTDALVDLGK